MSQATLQPYLFFGGRCEEAVEFYRDALGAEVEMMMRFRDNPEPPAADATNSPPAGWEDKIMHVGFRISGALILASDGCGAPDPFGGFGLALNVPNEFEADRHFHALAEGGQVLMPLVKTFWSPRFGMVTDRFGICWMIGVEPETP